MPLSLLAKAAITAGTMAANMALTMSRKIEGPRLDNLKVTTADYGTPLPMIWGKRRIEGCPIIWAEPIQEVKRESKTKGGKYNDYTYFGTFAIALASHEIDGITRLWFDRHLVLDLTGAGPITPFPIGTTDTQGKGKGQPGFSAANLNDHYAIYLGTDTQEVDERIAATTEAEHGADSASAYRGTAYIVFKDLPLEKFGNRIPQVSAEIVREASANYPKTTIDTDKTNIGFVATPSLDGNRWLIYYDNGGNAAWQLYDAYSTSKILEGTFPFDADATGNYAAPAADGGWYVFHGEFLDGDLYYYSADMTTATFIGNYAGASSQVRIHSALDGEGYGHWLMEPEVGGVNQTYVLDGEVVDPEAVYGAAFYARDLFADTYGDVWAVGPKVGDDTIAVFQRVVNLGVGGGSGYLEVSGLASNIYDIASAYHYRDATHDHFVLSWGETTYLIDKNDGAVLGSVADYLEFRDYPVGRSTGWSVLKEYDLADLSLVRTVSTQWGSIGTTDRSFYDPINHALVTFHGTDTFNVLYLDRITGSGTTLGAIAGELADMVGVEDYDFTALDQSVLGWSATPGDASSILEPLLDAYDSDIRPHDFTIQGVKRGGTASLTLATSTFVAGEDRYTVKVRQAAELPRSLTYTFADDNKDQQPNAVRVDRPVDATGAREDRNVDMGTLAGTATTIRALAERHFWRIWNSRREAAFGLTAQQLALEPADLRVLELDGEEWGARLVSVTMKADDSLSTEWVYDDPAVALLGGDPGGEADGYRESTVSVGAVSKGFALDIPLLTDADSSANPVIYFAASAYDNDAVWPGADIFESIGGEYTGEVQSVPTSRRATWGYTTDALADANPWLWDRGNTVNVSVLNGSLVSVTEAEIDAQPTLNMALIGDEIVNFTTATLEGDGSYTLSGFKRGRRGTEWACATHAERDVFLLLSAAQEEEAGLSDVGTDLSFKAVTTGRLASSAFAIDLSFTGASLKPYAPVALTEVKESSGDWTLGWTRRTRVGGAWTSGTTIPLSEASEEYEVEILNGSTVVRTVTGLTSPSYTYTDANQVTDFGSTQSSLSWRVYQISDAVGRGFAAAG